MSPAECNGLLCDITAGEQAYEDRQAEGVCIGWVFFAWVCVDVFLWYVTPFPSPSPSPSPPDPDPDPDPDLRPCAGFNGGLAFSTDLHAAQACIMTNLAVSVGGLTWMLWVLPCPSMLCLPTCTD